MPKLYLDGTVSDASVNGGVRGTPAVREAAVAAVDQTTETTKENKRKVEKAAVWLTSVYAPSAVVGTAVAVATVRTAGNAAGQATADVNSALVQLTGPFSRLVYDGTTVTRRF